MNAALLFAVAINCVQYAILLNIPKPEVLSALSYRTHLLSSEPPLPPQLPPKGFIFMKDMFMKRLFLQLFKQARYSVLKIEDI